MLVRMWRNQNSPSLLVGWKGWKNGIATLEDSLAVSDTNSFCGVNLIFQVYLELR